MSARPSHKSQSIVTRPTWIGKSSVVCGTSKLNGNDVWAIFRASAEGDLSRVKLLLEKDPRLVRSEIWYSHPIHFAVWTRNLELVKLLLRKGANAGQSTFMYYSWHTLLEAAKERGDEKIAACIRAEMESRYNYSESFQKVKRALLSRRVSAFNRIARSNPELLETSDELGNNACHVAVSQRSLEMIRACQQQGVPIDAMRADGATPALLALSWFRPFPPPQAMRNRWVMIGALLNAGADYCMSIAAATGDLERVDYLVNRDASLACRLDSSCVSPLAYAAREGHLHIVQRLLELGADPNLPEAGAPRGAALFYSCWANRYEVAKLLLDNGADPDGEYDSSGCCLTIGKHYYGAKANPIRALLKKHGAQKPPYDMSTRQLREAILEGKPVVKHPEFMGNVLGKGNVDLLNVYLDHYPNIPKQLQHHSGVFYPSSSRLLDILIKRGLDPNQPDWEGNRFLHSSATRLDIKAVSTFVNAGAEVDAIDVKYRQTALSAAIRAPTSADVQKRDKLERNRRKIIDVLIEHGASPNPVAPESFDSPLILAKQNGLPDVVKKLKDRGATR